MSFTAAQRCGKRNSEAQRAPAVKDCGGESDGRCLLASGRLAVRLRCWATGVGRARGHARIMGLPLAARNQMATESGVSGQPCRISLVPEHWRDAGASQSSLCARDNQARAPVNSGLRTCMEQVQQRDPPSPPPSPSPPKCSNRPSLQPKEDMEERRVDGQLPRSYLNNA